jgi:hypothetical protein
MPTTRRIRIGRAVILAAIAVLAVALMPVFGDTWVTVQPERLAPVESPTGPVGSGLDLPLDGGR